MRRQTADDDGVGEAVKDALKALPCGICREATSRETLMNRGSMCQGCFTHYCERGPAAQGRIGLGRKGSSR
jgi:hypothetical protein